jgi:hypothetical protein
VMSASTLAKTGMAFMVCVCVFVRARRGGGACSCCVWRTLNRVPPDAVGKVSMPKRPSACAACSAARTAECAPSAATSRRHEMASDCAPSPLPAATVTTGRALPSPFSADGSAIDLTTRPCSTRSAGPQIFCARSCRYTRSCARGSHVDASFGVNFWLITCGVLSFMLPSGVTATTLVPLSCVKPAAGHDHRN